MEQNQLDRETFSCSICLDLLKDPVTIPCGHSYCMSCITDHWDAEDQKGIHSCPQCRETFTPRPALKRSTMLAALVEQMKKTGLQTAPADHRYAGPEDVACEICTGRKLKAIKSCLVCLVSYCENHLQPHLDVPGLKNHKLVEPSRNLQENICSQHDEVMKITISLMVSKVHVLLSEPEPESITRAGFLKYSCEITLDPNTAYRYLVLSEGNRKVTLIKQPQSSSSHPDRFTKYSQVLSRESLTGRCYWEVEWKGMISVAVAYKNIGTAGQGKKCGFAGNDISWALDCSSSKFGHNNIWTDVSGPVSSRVGVYLDHRAGLLSFYSISETMTLIHRVQTTFTEPLHAGVTVGWFGASAEFCKPN
ncbi:tripartite motif-containing protein 16-like [Poecilia formosa]|uniref:tripartite motif-containing protein 16-like n=1 Tax=Poecilia formosa TaxID=48698 RepID=UPI0007BA4C42|nr:PREDICTED: tripartite motif-containing protein 16-like [Poecilia formosa]